jgi:hypothetical protein
MKISSKHLLSLIRERFQVSGCLLLAIAFAAAVPSLAGAAEPPQSERMSQRHQRPPAKKMSHARQSLSGEEIREARERLGLLGYWLDLDATGADASLRHALIAFQKVEGRERTGVLTKEELDALRDADPPKVMKSGYPHIEIDLDRQVLFMIDCGGVALRILPISSGSGEFFTEGGVTRQADTPIGRFEIYRQVEGWRKSPLGLLYYPNYIDDGIAIHGNPSVPTRPASHGCIRIPMFAAREFSEMVTVGMEVIVYRSAPLAQT